MNIKTILSILKLLSTLFVISVIVKSSEKLLNVIHYVIYRGEKPRVFKLKIPESWDDIYYYFLIAIALGLAIYLIYLIVMFRKVIFNFSKDYVFTKENSERLRQVGKGLVIYGLVVLGFTMILEVIINDKPILDISSDPSVRRGYAFGYKVGYAIGTSISKVLPIFVIALFVQFTSFIVVKGNVLQEENDLTI